jgi:hypothetical protein
MDSSFKALLTVVETQSLAARPYAGLEALSLSSYEASLPPKSIQLALIVLDSAFVRRVRVLRTRSRSYGTNPVAANPLRILAFVIASL